MPEPIETITTPIALEARDLLPETWNALAGAKTFGPAAIERRHNRIVARIFGTQLDEEAQEALDAIDVRLIEYAGKRLALVLLDPAIDYWSKQRQAYTAGDQESVTYGDRIKELQELKKQWLVDIANLEVQLDPVIPVAPTNAEAPIVAQVGDTIEHVTVNPLLIPPSYLEDRTIQ